MTGEVDQRTLDRLRAMTRTPTSDELHNRAPKPSASGLDSRCLTGRAMCISKRTNSLVWVVDGKAQLRMDVRFGSDETPTREGSFSVGWKSRNHVSTIYHTPMPYAMFFSGGQAVHYSPTSPPAATTAPPTAASTSATWPASSGCSTRSGSATR